MVEVTDASDLPEKFRKIGLLHTARLIEILEKEERLGLAELGSATIIDEKGLLDPLTLKLHERFGFQHTPSAFDPIFQERHKALKIGRSGSASRVAVLPLEWFARLWEVHTEIPRASLLFFDIVAEQFVKVEEALEISDFESVENFDD